MKQISHGLAESGQSWPTTQAGISSYSQWVHSVRYHGWGLEWNNLERESEEKIEERIPMDLRIEVVDQVPTL